MPQPQRFDVVIIGSGQAAGPLATALAGAGRRTRARVIQEQVVRGTVDFGVAVEHGLPVGVVVEPLYREARPIFAGTWYTLRRMSGRPPPVSVNVCRPPESPPRVPTTRQRQHVSRSAPRPRGHDCDSHGVPCGSAGVRAAAAGRRRPPCGRFL